jgi:glucose-6-phosphate 1-epimerase
MNDNPVILTTPDGARAEISPHGAHVTSWVPSLSSGGEERLFLSRDSEFGPDSSIRGGVPVIFPQFGGDGPLPKHGFARRMDWETLAVQSGEPEASARFGLSDDEASREIWPVAFHCELAVRLSARSLELELSVENPGEKAISFTAGLHTYLRVAEIRDTWVEGLGGCSYLETVGILAERVQAEKELRFTGEVDRIYWKPPRRLVMHEKGRRLAVETDTFPQVVVWNPWIQKSAALADMETEGYRRMLCIEAVATGSAVILRPSMRWSGIQRLIA